MIRKTDYEILGVEKNATADELKVAYKRLMQKHHPDKGGNFEEFHKIQKAYKRLTRRPCPLCNGVGRIEERNGAFKSYKECPECLAPAQ